MRNSLKTGFYSLDRGFVPSPGKPLSVGEMKRLGLGQQAERVVTSCEYRRAVAQYLRERG